MTAPLSLFYAEPDPDRWLPGDRFPRRWIRRLARGPRRPGGQERVFINLCAGLDRLGVPYTVNRYRHALRNPDMPIGIIGKSHVLDLQPWHNPILFGASIMSHPLEDPKLLERLPNIRRVLVPGEWMRAMCAPYWGDRVQSWPVGIDTQAWAPPATADRDVDVLVYDKVRWEHDHYQRELIDPILTKLRSRGLRVATIRYGYYKEEDFAALLRRTRSMIFLCEHETQGIAYQQTLACGIPIFAWDRGGYWQDPQYYPDRIRFGPVSSVPYWDERCGLTFSDATAFTATFDAFWDNVSAQRYRPRDYILENLTLEKCAQLYLDQWHTTFGSVA
ncbi:glycosyltransferase [Rariglobus hedericola]|uniref:glycosyltransferase n=1 Tax=Rariglobus hedericola TaxID=2597822 RepID=UPI001396CC1D|nr:glycosyltransferase [Rariglobus hedericola]